MLDGFSYVALPWRRIRSGRPGSKSPAKPRSVASVDRELSLLSRIFSIAVTNKEALTNPCRDVKHIPGEQPRTRYLLPEEEQRLMNILARKPAYLSRVVTLALNTGMRRGELLRLKWDQIDFFRDRVIMVLRAGADGQARLSQALVSYH